MEGTPGCVAASFKLRMWTGQSRGRMAKIARKTTRHPSDLTDEERERIASLMPKPGHRGRPCEVQLREVINAVRHLARPGRGWRMLPVHFGHWRTIHGWLRELARRSLFQTIHDVELMPDRERAGREASPSAAMIGDRRSAEGHSQSIKAPHANAKGYDAAKRIAGRKHHIAVDTDEGARSPRPDHRGRPRGVDLRGRVGHCDRRVDE